MPLPALILILLLGACGSRPVGVAEPAPIEIPGDTVKAIEGAVEQYRQAYEVRSAEALAELYRRDLDLVVVHQGNAFVGWTQVEAFIAARLAGATKARLRIKELKVLELGATAALASASLEATIGDDATTVTEKGALTLAFQKVGDEWKLVAEHFSYPTGPS